MALSLRRLAVRFLPDHFGGLNEPPAAPRHLFHLFKNHYQHHDRKIFEQVDVGFQELLFYPAQLPGNAQNRDVGVKTIKPEAATFGSWPATLQALRFWATEPEDQFSNPTVQRRIHLLVCDSSAFYATSPAMLTAQPPFRASVDDHSGETFESIVHVAVPFSVVYSAFLQASAPLKFRDPLLSAISGDVFYQSKGQGQTTVHSDAAKAQAQAQMGQWRRSFHAAAKSVEASSVDHRAAAMQGLCASYLNFSDEFRLLSPFGVSLGWTDLNKEKGRTPKQEEIFSAASTIRLACALHAHVKQNQKKTSLVKVTVGIASKLPLVHSAALRAGLPCDQCRAFEVGPDDLLSHREATDAAGTVVRQLEHKARQ